MYSVEFDGHDDAVFHGCRIPWMPYSVEFDGHNDAVFQATDRLGNPQFEYIKDRGTFADVPYRQIVDAWIDAYGVMLETPNI